MVYERRTQVIMKVQKKIILLSLLAVIASLYSVIFFRNAHIIYTTGDLSFHLSRIKGLASVFSGPVNFTIFNNYGSGVNYFYPYLTIFPAVIFYWITNNLVLSYVLYVWVLNICTILVIFHYGQKFLKRIDAAFLFSCLYTFYGYRTIDIYHRSAIAEAIALTIIPAVLYYAYEIIFEGKKSAVPLAISMSLLVYTHVLSTLMSSVIIGLLIVGCLLMKKITKRNITRLLSSMAQAVGMTIILSAYFWYPMIRQALYQEVNKPFKTELQSQALSIFDSFKGALNNDMTTYTMGIIGMASLILPLIIFKKFTGKEKIIYISAVISWFLSTTLFPWVIVQNTPVQLIQFPWRVLGFQVLFGSLILTITFMKSVADKKKSSWIILGSVLLLVVMAVAAKENYLQKIESIHGHIVVTEEKLDYYTTSGTGGLYDYAPIEALNYKEHLEKHEVRVGNKWEASSHEVFDSSIVYKVQDADGQKITLPVYEYWGTVVKVNGEKRRAESHAGLVTVEGTEGVNTIEVSSRYPLTMLIALFISLVSFIFMISRIWLEYRKNKMNLF
jgi:hypothetical protein